MNDTRNVNEERKRRRNLTISAAIAGLVIVLIMGGLLLRSRGATQASTVKIAVQLPSWFPYQLNGLLVALDEAGGMKLTLQNPKS